MQSHDIVLRYYIEKIYCEFSNRPCIWYLGFEYLGTYVVFRTIQKYVAVVHRFDQMACVLMMIIFYLIFSLAFLLNCLTKLGPNRLFQSEFNRNKFSLCRNQDRTKIRIHVGIMAHRWLERVWYSTTAIIIIIDVYKCNIIVQFPIMHTIPVTDECEKQIINKMRQRKWAIYVCRLLELMGCLGCEKIYNPKPNEKICTILVECWMMWPFRLRSIRFSFLYFSILSITITRERTLFPYLPSLDFGNLFDGMISWAGIKYCLGYP